MSVVGAVFVEGWWLAFPDIKSACLAAALGEIFATMEEKYGKCRTSDGRPQTISFQDVERSGLRGNFWRFVILRCCFKGELENRVVVLPSLWSVQFHRNQAAAFCQISDHSGETI